MTVEKERADAHTIYEVISVIYKRVNMLYSRHEKILKNIGELAEKARERASNRTADRMLLTAAGQDNLHHMICELQLAITQLIYIATELICIAQKAGGDMDGQRE